MKHLSFLGRVAAFAAIAGGGLVLARSAVGVDPNTPVVLARVLLASSLVLILTPIYLTFETYKLYKKRIHNDRRQVQETADLHLATIEALARAIEAKDQTAQRHVRRVQFYSAALARAAGLSDSDVQGVRTAALLHDVGKLAIPEHILSKPGPLTDDEFQKVRSHPEVGAQILAGINFPYPVAPLILSHHERWDGCGYPHGLKGEAIPIGARVLTIVDYYDALTTERPYHGPLSHESAVGILKHEAGRALDPALTAMFIGMLPTLAAEFEPIEEEGGRVAHAEGRPPGAPSDGASVFENIALAHREIYALYEIAQAMGTSLGIGDTMALISSKLSKIVPWSGCALFLVDGDNTIRCRYATGVDAPRLLNGTLTFGVGLCGWVAQTRRMLVNADPRITFQALGIQEPVSLASAIVCPLLRGDELIGCLAVYHVDRNRYTQDHRRLLEQVAEQAGTVIHNSIVFEQTQEDSLTDPLTGLPNRRSMFAYLSRELARAERSDLDVAVMVLDVDGFKAINDTYGHQVGDHALRSIAATLRSSLRPYDLCVRYAGDEFIIVLTNCSAQEADAKRLELQAAISRIELEARPGRPLTLAASAGVAVFPADGTTYEALLAMADHRMYQDKATRRAEIVISA